MPTAVARPDRDDLAARLAQLEQRRAGATPRRGVDPAPTERRRRRRHPAWPARLGAVVMSLASSVALSAYFVHATPHSSQAVGSAAVVVAGGPAGSAPAAPPATTGSTTSPSQDSVQNAAAPSTTPSTEAPTTRPPTTVPRANTVVNGTTFENQYGPVQVQATFSPNGQLVAASALQSPAGRTRSVAINQQAVPVLDSEALSVQSAQVNAVSGATYTSDSYRQSLQSALDAARAAHVTTIA